MEHHNSDLPIEQNLHKDTQGDLIRESPVIPQRQRMQGRSAHASRSTKRWEKDMARSKCKDVKDSNDEIV
jgi:hypothetical protein